MAIEAIETIADSFSRIVTPGVMAVIFGTIAVALVVDAYISTDKKSKKWLRIFGWIPITITYAVDHFLSPDPILFRPVFRMAQFVLGTGELIYFLDVLLLAFTLAKKRIGDLLTKS